MTCPYTGQTLYPAELKITGPQDPDSIFADLTPQWGSKVPRDDKTEPAPVNATNSCLPGDDKVEALLNSTYTPECITCADVCTLQAKKNKEGCDLLRKKVAQYLKSRGCPSQVRSYKKASKRVSSVKTPSKTSRKR